MSSCDLRFGVGVHHAPPGLPGLAVALDHSVLEEALARSDAVARQVQSVVDGEDEHEADGQQLPRVLNVVGIVAREHMKAKKELT